MRGLHVWQTTTAAFVGAMFWILVIALPSSAEPWPGWVQVSLGLVGVGAVVVGVRVAKTAMSKEGEDRGQQFAIGVTLILVGVVLIILAFMTTQELNLTPERRFGVGVGGAALVGFVYSVTQFDTLRAVAAVPIVVLLIGVVAWPDASELIGESVQKEIIRWIGVILAASGASEAAKQIGETNAKAKAGSEVASSQVSATGDLER